MDKAVDFAKEIVRKEKAVIASNSEKLKREYGKSIKSSMKELEYYCKCFKITVDEVMEKARRENGENGQTRKGN